MLLISLFVSIAGYLEAQISVISSDGYTVHIEISPQSIVAPGSCPSGYNYNVYIGYSITFTGSNIPASLYSLNGHLFCTSQDNYFDLPNSGGVGYTTSTSNQFVGTSDCTTSTPSSLGCNSGIIYIEGPGITGQDVAFSSNLVPIELTSFTSQKTKEGVLLKWETASEINNHYFTIEKSLDGFNYREIGNIEGNGTTNKTFEYQYLDSEITGDAYYRLKQTDFDGTFNYKGWLYQEYIDQQGNDITFFPNPNHSNTIQWTGEVQGNHVFEIYTQTGKLIYSANLFQKKELNLFLDPGLYFLHIVDDKNQIRTITKYIQF